MRVFADHCVHRDVIAALREAGFEVERARDHGLDRAGDEEIFRCAQKLTLPLFTFDKDFGNTARFDITHSRGVVLVYIERMSRGQIIRRVLSFFKETREPQLARHLFLIEPHEVRRWPR